jgi:hypothetical protein
VRQLPAFVTRHRALGVFAVAALTITTCTGGPAQLDGDLAGHEGAPAATLPTSDAIVLPVHGDGELLLGVADRLATTPTLDDGGVAPEDVAGDEVEVETEAPAAAPEAELPDEVALVEPDLVLRAGDGERFTSEDVQALEGDRGVAHVAEVAEFDLEGGTVDGERAELTAFAVGVEDFRPLTPDVTAQTVGVWQRLLDGDVLVRHDVAHELGLELGGTMVLSTDDGTVPVRVGAFAANGAPPLADLLVPREVAELLGVTGSNALVVASGGPEPTHLKDRLEDALGGAGEVLRAPEPQRSTPKVTGSVTLEPFSYTSRGDGTIKIDPAWVQRNIVTVDIPNLGRTRCHRAMVPQLMAALREVHEAGLYGHFKREQFAGCFMPRHILWNPSRPLSMHAWGLAIDFNSIDNAFGKTPVMDRRIVEIFERWGFEWGGHWSTPDGMHFQLARIVEVP